MVKVINRTAGQSSMLRVAISSDAPKRRGVVFSGLGSWPVTTRSSMTAGFLIAAVLAAVMLAIFGAGDRGTTIALRATARWSFLLFWLAYVGGAMAKLFGPRFNVLAQQGRTMGLTYAAAQLVHVALIFWLFYLAAGPRGGMLVFWAGIVCTYLLALFSWPRLRDALGPRLWRLLLTITVEYIAFVFAVDFILLPLQAHGAGGYPLSYVPFAVMLVGGAGLRIAASVRSRLAVR
jgi:hypothetical protein